MTAGASPDQNDTARPRRRLLPRIRLSGLALISVGLLAAAILGIQMGQSAISEINPIHFQGALERPQAITPPPEPAPYDPYAQRYEWTIPAPPATADCGGTCETPEMRQAMRLAMDISAGRDASLPPWRDATPNTELRPWAPGETPDLPIARYMSYPVNREQAERAAAAPAPPRTEAPPPVTASASAEALRPPPATPAPAAGEPADR